MATGILHLETQAREEPAAVPVWPGGPISIAARDTPDRLEASSLARSRLNAKNMLDSVLRGRLLGVVVELAERGGQRQHGPGGQRCSKAIHQIAKPSASSRARLSPSQSLAGLRGSAKRLLRGSRNEPKLEQARLKPAARTASATAAVNAP